MASTRFSAEIASTSAEILSGKPPETALGSMERAAVAAAAAASAVTAAAAGEVADDAKRRRSFVYRDVSK